MRRAMPSLLLSLLLLTAMPVFAQAAEDDGDDLVRLPGQGEVNPDTGLAQRNLGRLVPGGGLFASFDTDDDGRISAEELATGTEAAFKLADANGDGQLVALEQLDWAAGLPTRDDTLANPVRFDPNLDRVVTFDEFRSVIALLAANYQDERGVIEIARLSAPEPRQDRDDRRPLPGDTPPDRVGATSN
ncbi:MAG: EF-hand domain-containing protein [Hyphomonas sp.]